MPSIITFVQNVHQTFSMHVFAKTNLTRTEYTCQDVHSYTIYTVRQSPDRTLPNSLHNSGCEVHSCVAPHARAKGLRLLSHTVLKVNSVLSLHRTVNPAQKHRNMSRFLLSVFLTYRIRRFLLLWIQRLLALTSGPRSLRLIKNH